MAQYEILAMTVFNNGKGDVVRPREVFTPPKIVNSLEELEKLRKSTEKEFEQLEEDHRTVYFHYKTKSK